MAELIKYKKNTKFNTTLINFIYQFECENEEVIAFTILSNLLTKSSKKYNTEGKFYNAKLEKYIINYNVSSQYINKVYFLNISIIIPNIDIVKDFDLKDAINFMLNSIYENNLSDKKLFELEKRNYAEYLLNNYKNIDFISNKTVLDILDSDCVFNKLKYKDLNNIKDLTNDDILNFFNKYIKSIKPYIFVTGNTDIKLINTIICEYFSKYKFKRRKKYNKYNYFYNNYNLIEKSDKSNFNQSVVVNAYAIKNYKEEDFYKLYLVYLLLSSQSSDLLLENLRKKSNLVYTAGSSVFLKNGLLIVKTLTNKNNISTVNMIINSLLNDLSNTDKYIENIKRIIDNFEDNIVRDKDNFIYQSTIIINKYFNIDISREEELRKLKSITSDELKDFIKRIVCVLKYSMEGEL